MIEQADSTEVPFTSYLQAIGRGPGRSRHLTEEEAAQAFAAILEGRARPEQIGAFLLLLRYRGEAPQELAGIVRAARSSIGRPAEPIADLDWPSYAAGRSRGAPLFLLSALLLAQCGVRVLMHGDNDLQGPEAALATVGLRAATSLAEAQRQIAATGFAYLPLRHLSPRLHALLRLRDLLGLRTPVNSALRLLDPSGAEALIEGVFHPPYIALHAATAAAIGPRRVTLFKGGAGEAERNPLKTLAVHVVEDGAVRCSEWPAIVGAGRGARPERTPLARLADLWLGRAEDSVAEWTVIGTAAIALTAARPALDADAAHAMAVDLWRSRPRRPAERARVIAAGY